MILGEILCHCVFYDYNIVSSISSIPCREINTLAG